MARTRSTTSHRLVNGLDPKCNDLLCGNPTCSDSKGPIDPKTITTRYRQEALRTHPDKNRNDPNLLEQFKFLNECYRSMERSGFIASKDQTPKKQEDSHVFTKEDHSLDKPVAMLQNRQREDNSMHRLMKGQLRSEPRSKVWKTRMLTDIQWPGESVHDPEIDSDKYEHEYLAPPLHNAHDVHNLTHGVNAIRTWENEKCFWDYEKKPKCNQDKKCEWKDNRCRNKFIVRTTSGTGPEIFSISDLDRKHDVADHKRHLSLSQKGERNNSMAEKNVSNNSTRSTMQELYDKQWGPTEQETAATRKTEQETAAKRLQSTFRRHRLIKSPPTSPLRHSQEILYNMDWDVPTDQEETIQEPDSKASASSTTVSVPKGSRKHDSASEEFYDQWQCDSMNDNPEECILQGGCKYNDSTKTCTKIPSDSRKDVRDVISCSRFNRSQTECDASPGCFYVANAEACIPKSKRTDTTHTLQSHSQTLPSKPSPKIKTMDSQKQTAAFQLNIDEEQRRRDLEARFKKDNPRPLQWTTPQKRNSNYVSEEAAWQKDMQAFVKKNWSAWAVPAQK